MNQRDGFRAAWRAIAGAGALCVFVSAAAGSASSRDVAKVSGRARLRAVYDAETGYDQVYSVSRDGSGVAASVRLTDSASDKSRPKWGAKVGAYVLSPLAGSAGEICANGRLFYYLEDGAAEGGSGLSLGCVDETGEAFADFPLTGFDAATSYDVRDFAVALGEELSYDDGTATHGAYPLVAWTGGDEEILVLHDDTGHSGSGAADDGSVSLYDDNGNVFPDGGTGWSGGIRCPSCPPGSAFYGAEGVFAEADAASGSAAESVAESTARGGDSSVSVEITEGSGSAASDMSTASSVANTSSPEISVEVTNEIEITLTGDNAPPETDEEDSFAVPVTADVAETPAAEESVPAGGFTLGGATATGCALDRRGTHGFGKTRTCVMAFAGMSLLLGLRVKAASKARHDGEGA